MKIDISKAAVHNLFTAVQLEQLRGWLFLLTKLDLSGTCHPTCMGDVNVMHYINGNITLNHKQLEVFRFNPETHHIELDDGFFNGVAKKIDASAGGVVLTIILDHYQHVSGLNANRFITTVKGYARKTSVDFVNLLMVTAAVSDKPLYSADGWLIQKVMGQIQLVNPVGMVVISSMGSVLTLGPTVITESPLAENLLRVIGTMRKHVLAIRADATVHHRMFTKAFTKEWLISKKLFPEGLLWNAIMPNGDCVTITDKGFEYTYVYGNTSGFVVWKPGDKSVIIDQLLLDAFNDPEFGVPDVANHLNEAVEKYVQEQCQASVSGITNEVLRDLGITPFRLPKHYRAWKNAWNGSQMTFQYFLRHSI